MAASKTLSRLREEIDAVDKKLLRLLSKRAELALAIGKAKSRRAQGILDVGREKKVIGAICEANQGPLRDETVEAIFREIISACRASQQPTSVAFLGPEGTYTHEAAVKQFARSADFLAVQSIGEVFASVESGRSAFGVVPIENTTEGAVTPTLDALADTGSVIRAELVVKIDHCLMAQRRDLSRIRRIASHPQVLAQCRRYLAEHFPRVEVMPMPSSAAAAKVAASRVGTAAIGSREAARLYGLELVARSIQDNPANVTRFLIIGVAAKSKRTGDDRTSLVISVKDEVGILERIIRQFSRNKVNLSMIESRPLIGRPWEYRFFVDVTGHVNDRSVERALRSVERLALSVKVLGSYPIAE